MLPGVLQKLENCGMEDLDAFGSSLPRLRLLNFDVQRRMNWFEKIFRRQHMLPSSCYEFSRTGDPIEDRGSCSSPTYHVPCHSQVEL